MGSTISNNDWEYQSPNDFCKVLGPQSREQWQLVREAYSIVDDEKVIGSETGGFCAAWSLMYIHARITNPDLSDLEVVRLVLDEDYKLEYDYESDKYYTILSERIRKYAQFIAQAMGKEMYQRLKYQSLKRYLKVHGPQVGDYIVYYQDGIRDNLNAYYGRVLNISPNMVATIIIIDQYAKKFSVIVHEMNLMNTNEWNLLSLVFGDDKQNINHYMERIDQIISHILSRSTIEFIRSAQKYNVSKKMIKSILGLKRKRLDEDPNTPSAKRRKIE